MSAQISAARRAAFLKALAETGSLTLSARRARVGKDWSLWHRKRDPVFAAVCREAIAAAKVSIDATRDARGMAPPSGWGSLDGVELVVRGAPGRRAQIRRARVDGWSPAVETRFLAVLAGTCNVLAACREIRMTQASAYDHRRRWPAFEKLWEAAIEEGYARLELALLENANNLFSPSELPPAVDMPPMYATEAIHLLHMHRRAVTGVGGVPGAQRPGAASPDELSDALIKIMGTMERGKSVAAARRARDEREFARRRAVLPDGGAGDGGAGGA